MGAFQPFSNVNFFKLTMHALACDEYSNFRSQTICVRDTRLLRWGTRNTEILFDHSIAHRRNKWYCLPEQHFNIKISTRQESEYGFLFYSNSIRSILRTNRLYRKRQISIVSGGGKGWNFLKTHLRRWAAFISFMAALTFMSGSISANVNLWCKHCIHWHVSTDEHMCLLQGFCGCS